MALGILIASRQLPKDCISGYEVGGELALSGELRPFAGSLPMVVAAQKQKRSLILPKQNANECAFVRNAKIFSADHLLNVCHHLSGAGPLKYAQMTVQTHSVKFPDIAEVCGQKEAKRAIEIAAAGGHSVLMIGTPGSGKTMLALRLPGILPSMTDDETVEVAAIASLSGVNFDVSQKRRPFRSPHHSASHIALVGGGRLPRPGEVSLAHRGVLFLDELLEFNRNSLEALREPLESGEVLVSRAAYCVKYPAQFQLIAAMNPCPCGYWGDERGRCQCSRDQVQRYQAKISGPLLDRIDLHVWMRAVNMKQLLETNPEKNESSATVQARVLRAQRTQLTRAKKLNCFLTTPELQKYCELSDANKQFMHRAIEKLGLSARVYHRIVKVARTVADLAQAKVIQREHLQEVLMLRKFSL